MILKPITMGKFGDTLKGIAGGATGTAITGAVGGLVGALGIGNKQQLRQQGKLTEQAAEINSRYGEQAAQRAFERQREMYAISRADQAKKHQMEVEDMKKAGLSIGLMNGGGQGSGGMGAIGGGIQADTGAAGGGIADGSRGHEKSGIEYRTYERRRTR